MTLPKEANVMAENTVSLKDTPRQEPIKHFEAGVVSYFLFDELYHDIDLLFRRLKLLVMAGFDDEKYMDTALDLIEKLVLDAEGKLSATLEKARDEKSGAGGNGVYVMQRITKVRRELDIMSTLTEMGCEDLAGQFWDRLFKTPEPEATESPETAT